MEHIFALRALMEICAFKTQSLCFVFLVVKTAYDTVQHASLLDAVAGWKHGGISSELCSRSFMAVITRRVY
jgi:hypothetical protein